MTEEERRAEDGHKYANPFIVKLFSTNAIEESHQIEPSWKYPWNSLTFKLYLL